MEYTMVFMVNLMKRIMGGGGFTLDLYYAGFDHAHSVIQPTRALLQKPAEKKQSLLLHFFLRDCLL